jgi:hypothetical protein
MVYDVGSTNWDMMTSHAAGDTLDPATKAIDTLSYNLWYDASGGVDKYKRWSGVALADGLDNRAMPFVGSFGMVYDTVATKWDMTTSHAAGDGLAATQPGMDIISYTHYFDGTNERRWLGGQASSDAIASTTYMPYTEAFGMAWDGTNWGRIYKVNTIADGMSTGTDALVTAATMMLYNGATLDMARSSATGGLMVNIENHPIAFDEANGWVNSKKTEIGTTTPAKTTTATAGGATATVVFASREIINEPNWCIYYSNVGANHLTDAAVQASPDNVIWITLFWTECDTLIDGSACIYCTTGSAYRYIRGTATAAVASETTIDAWFTANKD